MDLSNYTYEEPIEKNFIVLPKGDYDFSILEINEVEESKNGNPMIPLKLEFRDEAGQTTIVYDRLVFMQSAKWKIDQFLKCVSGSIQEGRKIDFESPEFLKWLKSRTGRARLRVAPVLGKDYDRNEVDAYLYESTTLEGTTVRTPASKSAPPSSPVDDIDDSEIPF